MLDNPKVLVSAPLLSAVQGGLDHTCVQLLPVIHSLGMPSHLPFSGFSPDIELPPGLSQKDVIPNPLWFMEAFTKGNKEKILPTGQCWLYLLPGYNDLF